MNDCVLAVSANKRLASETLVNTPTLLTIRAYTCARARISGILLILRPCVSHRRAVTNSARRGDLNLINRRRVHIVRTNSGP